MRSFLMKIVAFPVRVIAYLIGIVERVLGYVVGKLYALSAWIES